MFALPNTFAYFFLANLICTLFLTGIIFFVQFVHYPLFFQVKDHLPDYTEKNLRFTGMVTVPVMVIEALSALWLAFDPVFPNLDLYFDAGVILVIIAWLSTFFLQYPQHRKLLNHYDEVAIKKLVRANWIRVIAWTLRAVLMIYLIFLVSGRCFPTFS